MKKTGKYVIVFNSVSANVVHDARNDAGVASAKWPPCFWKRRKFATKYILYLSEILLQC